MQAVQITDKNQLNEFVAAQDRAQFLQSYEWGEFQGRIGEKIWRLGVEDDNGALVAVATLIKKRLPFGKNYFYCPRGPISHNIEHVTRNINFLFSEIKKIAESEKVIFLRFEPNFQITNFKFQITKTIDVQPSKTLILDLTKSEEELLKAMHEKTRYNIRLAEKKGVKIIEASVDKFEKLWELMGETSERDEFRLHGKDYYKAMLKITNGHKLITNNHRCFIKLFFAEYEDKPIATGIFSFFGETAAYLHGGSANKFRNAMAPYLLQWHVIKLVKSLGFKNYDFYGIDENKWLGVTRFKKGFGGFEVEYPGTFDLIFNKRWYNIYRMVRKIRRIF